MAGEVINKMAGNPPKPTTDVLVLGGLVLVLWAIGLVLLLRDLAFQPRQPRGHS